MKSIQNLIFHFSISKRFHRGVNQPFDGESGRAAATLQSAATAAIIPSRYVNIVSDPIEAKKGEPLQVFV